MMMISCDSDNENYISYSYSNMILVMLKLSKVLIMNTASYEQSSFVGNRPRSLPGR